MFYTLVETGIYCELGFLLKKEESRKGTCAANFLRSCKFDSLVPCEQDSSAVFTPRAVLRSPSFPLFLCTSDFLLSVTR